MKKQNIGSSFDDFLRDEGILEEVQEKAIKRVLSFQIQNAMREQQLTKTAMAKKMNTSRSVLNRLLNLNDDSTSLSTMKKAAHAVGRELLIQLA